MLNQFLSYLIQLSGSPSQSVLHLKRSHDSHPIGGVFANPLSKHSTGSKAKITNNATEKLKTMQFLLLIPVGTCKSVIMKNLEINRNKIH